MTEDQFDLQATPEAPPRSPPWALPIALAVAAVFATLIAAMLQLVDQRVRLHNLWQAQAAQMQQAIKFREQLQSLSAETARLADNGDAAAKKIVETMKQRGVTLTIGSHPSP
ncbi:MAG TPA: hypothetical protein VMI30_14165 [Stellaceae bacterium]|nr:hypothetical protein [Stellaceae bacterium]